MNELQRQLAALLSILDVAERNGLAVVGIQRCITAVNDKIYALRDLQRSTTAIVGPMTPAQRDTVAMLYNAPRTQVETDGDQLWA